MARYYKKDDRSYEVVALDCKADDVLDPDGIKILSFAQAQEKLREVYAKRQKEAAEPPARDTVSDVLDRYAADLKTKGGDKGNAARVRLHLPDELGGREAAKVEATELKAWRNGLAEKMPLSTVNRVITGLKAALNAAADLDARIAANRNAWRSGLKGFAGAGKSRNIILPEPVVRTIVEKAGAESPQFQLLVETLAVTGSRYDQVARLRVEDLQDRGDSPRLQMPTSFKGRSANKPKHRPVAIPASLAEKLRAAVNGREMDAQLLLRANGQPWGKSNHSRAFARVVKAAGLGPEVTASALRHSSIVRLLLKGVPGRVVAVNHDTSLAMIERTYSAHIADHADALTRKALLDVTEDSSGLAVVIN
jgi:integrase